MADELADNLFSQPSSTSDVVLVVEDKKLHVSKAVLSLMSPVFERMFYGEFKEKYSSEVPLPEKKHDEMLEFLPCIYPTTLKPLDRDDVEAVLLLADEYEVQRLLNNCIEYLIDNASYLSVSQKVHFLLLYENVDSLKDLFEKFLVEVANAYYFGRKNGGTSDMQRIYETFHRNQI